MEAASVNIGGSDFPDSLASYLQQIGKLPPLPPEEQEKLGNEIDAVTRELRYQVRSITSDSSLRNISASSTSVSGPTPTPPTISCLPLCGAKRFPAANSSLSSRSGETS